MPKGRLGRGSDGLASFRKAMFDERWMAAETIAAAFFFLLGEEVVGVICLVYLISVKLIFSDDPLCAFLPFLLVGLMVLRLYDSYDLFMSKRLFALPAVAALLFHFLFYPKAPRRGGLSKGYFAISVALALGGLFSLPISDYLSGTSLYYTYGSGFGMLLLYALLLGRICPRGEYDPRVFVAKCAAYAAFFLLFMIATQYLSHAAEIKEGGWAFSEKYLSSMSNNLSTTVLLTMPFLFYLSRESGVRGGVFFLVGVLEGVAAVLSLSRGGMIFASAMCAYLIGYTLWTDRAGRRRNLCLLFLVATAGCAVFLSFSDGFRRLYGEGVVDSGGTVRLLFVAAAVGTFFATAYAHALFRMKKGRAKRACLSVTAAVVLAALALFLWKFDSLKPLLVRADYYRGNMMIIAAENFGKYPIFGTGIGYKGLRRIYPNKEGMFGCYHCLSVQVVGSMGLVGVAAYLYMLRERLRVLSRAEDKAYASALFLSYLGLLWISLVNPGIFCPIVYGLQLAICFIAAEMREKMPAYFREIGY